MILNIFHVDLGLTESGIWWDLGLTEITNSNLKVLCVNIPALSA